VEKDVLNAISLCVINVIKINIIISFALNAIINVKFVQRINQKQFANYAIKCYVIPV
jgi:hypothetical protein